MRANFAASEINNVKNVISIPHGRGSVHSKISGYYSSKTAFTNGLTGRDWLSTKSYDFQFEFGLNKLKEFGEVKPTSSGWQLHQTRSDFLNQEIMQFQFKAMKHGMALEKGDSKTANKAYKEIHKNYLVLKKQNKLIELEPLLEHDSPYVRFWASRYLLQICLKKSEKILEELSKLKGISVAFDARMTLREWKEKNLKF